MVSGRSWRLQRGFNGAPLAGYQGMMAESIDNIRTALLHSSHAESIHTVMITSSLEKEGKSTVASQLAASLARSGRRTLLIDGDLRRPTLHQLFELPQDPGLCELLREEVDLEDVVRPTRVAGLWMVSAGRVDQEAVQSLAQEGLREPFVRLREEFDFVLIDAGPVLTDADALLFGQYVDGVILSILRDVSQVPRVFEACERLRSVDLRLLGAVVNGVSWGRYRSYYRPYTARVDEPAAV
jgi:capsular exopolysaccharide synthesis family protein